MFKVGMMTDYVSQFGDTNFCVDVIKEIGFDCADLTFYQFKQTRKLLDEFSGDDYKENALKIRKHLDDINFNIVQAHAPFPSHQFGDDEFNKLMMFQLKRTIEVCGILKIPMVVIHPFNDWPVTENTLLYKELLPLAIENNVIICTENMWNWDNENSRAYPVACSLPETFKEQVDVVNSKNLKACVDVGHAQMFSYCGISPKLMLETLGDRVACLHLHDNDAIHDQHKIPFTGLINWDEVVEVLKNIKYKGELIIETSPETENKTYEDFYKYWNDQLKAGRRIQNALKSA